MAEIEPMRGRRVRAVRCGVEGHGSGCELAAGAAVPPTRVQEEKAWRSMEEDMSEEATAS